MSWFNRIKEGITTSTSEKKETPEGLWYKCPSCKNIQPSQEHQNNMWVCLKCAYHERIGSEEYFSILFDENEFVEFNANMTSADPLNFSDTKKYADRLVDSQKKTGLKDAVRTASGKCGGYPLTIACMDFKFIGGSMGSVMGEKIARAIDYSIEHNTPFLMISKSGGARMMEAALSLMQMAKTSAKLTRLSDAKLPYISFLTDPMLGDLNIAEPGALIGFAGPRVVKETIGKDLPKGFQTSEFVLEHGFLDMIVPRTELKDRMTHILGYFAH
jgi:acetyl-CoA carboxylase carboxyl transferase subunit beta